MSDYCQRWDGGRHSWRHPSDGGFDPARYTVAPLDKPTAEAFVVTHHYAGEAPASRLCYGLHDRADDRLVGVAILSVPMQARVLTNVFPTLDPYAESLELGRFVLLDHVPANAESWMLARTFDLAADAGLRGVVSFSDPVPRDLEHADGTSTRIMPGHVGLIYQATNGYACGRSTPRTLTWLPRHGIVVSDRTLSKVRTGERGADGAERRLVDLGARARRAGETPGTWLTDALTDLGARKVRHPGNYRYAWTLGSKSARRRTVIAMPRTDYPKPATGRAHSTMPELDLFDGLVA